MRNKRVVWIRYKWLVVWREGKAMFGEGLEGELWLRFNQVEMKRLNSDS